jgi:hypothetical protein
MWYLARITSWWTGTNKRNKFDWLTKPFFQYPPTLRKSKRMDARHNASATTKVRENAMAALFNSEDTPLTMFPCPATTLREFSNVIKTKLPTATNTAVIGGLGKHYDMETQLLSGPFRTELKVTSGNPSALDVLEWRPWQDTVQFLQGQLKSKVGQRFLGDCGDPMLRAWFKNHVEPFALSQDAAAMTYTGYEKAMSTIGMKGKQEAAAVAFIKLLRENSDAHEELHKQWLLFEAEWLSTHTMNNEGLLEVVKEIIESKDAWVCVSKKGPQWIDGLKVAGLRFEGARPKPKGGMSFHYTLSLTKGGVTKEVPMECKFHWKNGGQAVQNLNFMLL